MSELYASSEPGADAVYDNLPAVLAALFDSLTDEEPWSTFLDALSAASGATWATLILTPGAAERPGIILTPGADPSIGQDYAARLFAGDPFTGLPEGKVMHFRDFVSDDTLRHNAAYRAFLTETSSDEVIGVDIGEASGLELRLRLTRDVDQPPFDRDDHARLESLVPHLRIALRLFDRLAADKMEQQIYAGAIAQMAVGMIILDREGKVIRLNARASTLLSEGDGIHLSGDRVTFDVSAHARHLRDTVKAGDLAAPVTIRIERPSGRGDLLLVIGGANAPDYVMASGGPAFVLFLNDPVHPPEISADAVRETLGLTQAEAATATAIASGASLANAAKALGVSLNTVRAHLRAIFAKTGVKRQSQLVHLVHHSLPGLSRGSAAPPAADSDA
jgi:DNA-binding CsgD family transcriptional regulator|tara:strand:+ start:17346 stop:18518 length:1173 start_codon:yes stop_codon:yes gene_type:complete